ncbi:MAG TPA: GTP-binding protein [Actinomycetales bacterium]|nr:GTP-binding protein [Actinomycetales bacterium]
MTTTILQDAAELVERARTVFEGDPDALTVLEDLGTRLGEPLRLAVAGIVKAGKSTIINAILGEQIAPTDAGECTRVVTWYRYSAEPSITLYPREGPPRQMRVRRSDGQILLGLDGLAPEEVDRIEIGWPANPLRWLILIDTPGIASLSTSLSQRSADQLVSDVSPSIADAMLYLTRHMHESDVRFLEAFRESAATPLRTVNAVGVLSRADEIGSGRIDSMISAGRVALRYERSPELEGVVFGVLPVAGLVAQGARTLTQREFEEFAALAALPRPERERVLVSADRFVHRTGEGPSGSYARRDLLKRFGLFGVRLATSLVRAGAASRTELASALLEHSGVNELGRFIRLHFGFRADELKARAALDGLRRLLDHGERPGGEEILEQVERVESAATGLAELALIADLRAGTVPLAAPDAVEALRILGGSGTDPRTRLGLAQDTRAARIPRRIEAELERWRALAESEGIEDTAREACRIVVRSLEAQASALEL